MRWSREWSSLHYINNWKGKGEGYPTDVYINASTKSNVFSHLSNQFFFTDLLWTGLCLLFSPTRFLHVDFRGYIVVAGNKAVESKWFSLWSLYHFLLTAVVSADLPSSRKSGLFWLVCLQTDSPPSAGSKVNINVVPHIDCPHAEKFSRWNHLWNWKGY